MSQRKPIVREDNDQTLNMTTSQEEHLSASSYDERQKNIKTENDPLSVHPEDMETDNKPYREIYVKQERADLMDENDEILYDKRPSEIPFSAIKSESKINMYTVAESETSDFDTRFISEEDRIINLDDTIKTEEQNQNIKLHSDISTRSSHSRHLFESCPNPEQDTECRSFGKGKDLQQKSQHFRDTYVHNNHQSTSGSEVRAKQTKSYDFSRRMERFNKVINPNETESSLNKSQINTKDDDKTSGFEENPEPHDANTSQCTVYQQKKGALKEKLENKDAFRQQGNRQNDVYNEDMAFFRSILSTIRTLRQEQKLKFRVDVMNLLLHYFERTPRRTDYQQNFQSYHQPLYNTTYIRHPGPVRHSTPGISSTQP